MTVPAMQGLVGFGPQGAKGTLASTFYRMPALDVDLGLIEESAVSPPRFRPCHSRVSGTQCGWHVAVVAGGG